MNDWVEAARSHAAAVVEAHERLETQRAAAASAAAVYRSDLAHARAAVAASQAAAAARDDRMRAIEADAVNVRLTLARLVGVGRDVASRIVAGPDNHLTFVRDSGHVIEKFQKEMADA